jgi:predicted short-subunit dehydrogenase-like oxidoreductase (DUF2520 family)
MASSDDETPYWVLISILTSSFPMEQSLAITLHRVAFDLYSRDDSVGVIDQPLAHGHVRNTRKEAVLGTLTGPVFEAELETERGKGEVRFLLTRQGLELFGAQAAQAGRPSRELLN